MVVSAHMTLITLKFHAVKCNNLYMYTVIMYRDAKWDETILA